MKLQSITPRLPQLAKKVGIGTLAAGALAGGAFMASKAEAQFNIPVRIPKTPVQINVPVPVPNRGGNQRPGTSGADTSRTNPAPIGGNNPTLYNNRLLMRYREVKERDSVTLEPNSKGATLSKIAEQRRITPDKIETGAFCTYTDGEAPFITQVPNFRQPCETGGLTAMPQSLKNALMNNTSGLEAGRQQIFYTLINQGARTSNR